MSQLCADMAVYFFVTIYTICKNSRINVKNTVLTVSRQSKKSAYKFVYTARFWFRQIKKKKIPLFTEKLSQFCIALDDSLCPPTPEDISN